MNTGHETQPKATAERIFTKTKPLLPPAATYTISARSKSSDAPVFGYLRKQYGNVPLREVDSLFGFVERSELYGGRAYRRRELSDKDVEQLNSAGIGVRLPLSNHSVERDEYERNLPLLEKYQRPGNFVIVTNDDLARWVRQDFPSYQIDAVLSRISRLIERSMKRWNCTIRSYCRCAPMRTSIFWKRSKQKTASPFLPMPAVH